MSRNSMTFFPSCSARNPKLTGIRTHTVRLAIQVFPRRANSGLDQISILVGLVGVTRPEESAQSVLATARYDMDMKMRHALTHPIVHANEGAVGLHSVLYRAGQSLD